MKASTAEDPDSHDSSERSPSLFETAAGIYIALRAKLRDSCSAFITPGVISHFNGAVDATSRRAAAMMLVRSRFRPSA